MRSGGGGDGPGHGLGSVVASAGKEARRPAGEWHRRHLGCADSPRSEECRHCSVPLHGNGGDRAGPRLPR